jgi:DNA-binding YbaB/EbfC family protein|tara:strand:+ start:301 stop:654 length:354 start_codon:yes stop_codon:yes gene_type:complete
MVTYHKIGYLMGENNEVRSMLEAATEIQSNLIEQRNSIAKTIVEGTAGGGVVRVSMQADGILIGVKIREEAVDPDDVTMLEDLVASAFRDALTKCGNVQAQALSSAETSTLLRATKE